MKAFVSYQDCHMLSARRAGKLAPFAGYGFERGPPAARPANPFAFLLNSYQDHRMSPFAFLLNSYQGHRRPPFIELTAGPYDFVPG